MNFDFLPVKFSGILNNYDFNKVYELRCRTGFPIKVLYGNNFFYLGEKGISVLNDGPIFTDVDLLQTINNVTENSIYAFNECLKKGFITLKNGIRIGVAGECVLDNGQVVTIKNVESLNVRIPHFINDCAKEIFPFVFSNDNIYNTLIISPPMCGKTTILKDLVLKINSLNIGSILVIDERGEFSSVFGENVDKIKFSDKLYAFDCGVRSMSPKIVVTDELCSIEDFLCVQKAVSCGIKILASCHASSVDDLIKKDFFIKDIFDKYIVLENNKLGVLKNAYDKDFVEV